MPISHRVEEVTLSNGARGVIVDVPGAAVAKFGIGFRTGNLDGVVSWPHQAGHILEHIAAGVTADPRYPTKASFVEAVETNGGWTNAVTDSYGIVYYGSGLVEDWRRIVELQRLVIERPKLVAEVLESERGNVIEELQGYADDNDRLAWELARKSLTDGAWLTAQESIADAKTVTLGQLTAHHDATHTLANMRFVIAADMSKSDASVVGVFDGWDLQAGVRVPVAAATLRADDPLRYQQRQSMSTVSITLMFAIDRGVSVEEVEIIDIINYLLFNSHASRILGAARERGICYGMSADRDIQTVEQTSWSVEFSVGRDNVGDVMDLIANELEHILQDGFDATELARAKSYNLGWLKMGGESAAALYDDYEGDFFRREQIVSYDRIAAVYPSITTHKVDRFLRELLSGVSSIGAVGPMTRDEFIKQAGTFVKLTKRLAERLQYGATIE